MKEEYVSNQCVVCDGALKNDFNEMEYKGTSVFVCCPLCSSKFIENRDFYIEPVPEMQ